MQFSKFLFLGNHIGLDFINTLILDRGEHFDLLQTPHDLLRWTFEAYLLPAGDYHQAERDWLSASPLAMEEALEDAMRLREAGLRALQSPAYQPTAIAVINEYLAVPALAARLSTIDSGFLLQDLPVAPEGLVPLIARHVSGIFTDLDPGLIKKCRNDKCVLYFYDTSKNRARTWCSMDLCGNRAKAAKHYQTRSNQVP